MSVVFSYLSHVVAVYNWCAESRCDDPESEWDEHESCGACGVTFPFLINDGEGDEEHVEEAVEDAHVEGNEEDDEFSEKKLERTNQENAEPFCKRS